MYYTFNAPRFNDFSMNSFFRPFFDAMNNMDAVRSDIREMPDCFMVQAVLPGIDPEKINVSVKGDELTIKVDRPQKDDHCKADHNCGAMGEGRPFCGPWRFERTYSLEGIDKDGITADYKNGIVYVKLPKEQKKEDEVRRIALGNGAAQNSVPVLTE